MDFPDFQCDVRVSAPMRVLEILLKHKNSRSQGPQFTMIALKKSELEKMSSPWAWNTKKNLQMNPYLSI